jgi:hypothetical protein
MTDYNKIEVLYPIPKKCVVCRDKFYVGMKIKKTSNNINIYYNTNEKDKIMLYLNQKFPDEITRYIIKFLKDIIIYSYGHVNCCNMKNKNITWNIVSQRDMVIHSVM